MIFVTGRRHLDSVARGRGRGADVKGARNGAWWDTEWQQVAPHTTQL